MATPPRAGAPAVYHGELWARLPVLGASLGALIAALIASIISLSATSPAPGPPLRPTFPIYTSSKQESTDVVAFALYERKIDVEYTRPRVSTVNLELRERSSATNVDADILAQEGIEYVLIYAKTTEQTGSVKAFHWDIALNHNGRVQTRKESLFIQVRYDTKDEFKTLDIPLEYEINMLDFPMHFYLGMIAIGVIASYALTEGTKLRERISKDVKEIKRPVGWLVFSLILTPALYVQFRQNVVLTDGALLNLLLAVPFGAGLDLLMGKAGGLRE